MEPDSPAKPGVTPEGGQRPGAAHPEHDSHLRPTVVNEQTLKVKIPHTEEGRAFLEKLHALLKTKDLPFSPVCLPGQVPEGADKKSPGTTYALALRLEQEGWPP